MKDNKRAVISIVVMALGTVFIAVGAMRGETAEVLRKAINICLECIGIG